MNLSQHDIMEEVSAELRRRRGASETELKRHEAECRVRDPRFAQIREQLTRIGVEIARAAMDQDGPERITRLAQQSKALQQERAALLAKLGKPEDYLTLRYTCPRCQDTGLVGADRCICVDRLYSELSAKKLNAVSPLALCSFSDFSLDYYSAEPDPAFGVSPREMMGDVLEYAKKYSSCFSLASRSLLLWGRPGLGKTHIALAVAGEVMKRGFSVVYLPSHQLFSSVDRERFSRDNEGDTLSAVLDCDLLIIDDLGTEFITALTQSNLYNIIDTRLRASRPTIVSTNLEDCELREKYPERLVSRLLYSYEDLLFVGKDIRKIKKFQ